MRWILKAKPEEEKVKKLAADLGVDNLIAFLLVQRGIETFEAAKKFFRPSLDDLHDPYLMTDMDKAVSRIDLAISKGENILVYGDYDVDGTTAVALVYDFLKTKTSNIATYIPDRYNEGYGVSYKGIDFADDNDVQLIIALDCGIKAIEKVAYAKEKGIDFVICDHHRPGEQLPEAVAVLDPKREDCNYPYDELCGCGIGFKLIQALVIKYKQHSDEILPYLDLVATAIAADIVPITGENRVLAYYGLRQINSKPRVGIAALIKQLKKRSLNITDVVFIIAPRINAAGRIKHGQDAVNLLIERDINIASTYAEEIEHHNQNRKDLDQQITKEALVQIEDQGEEENFTTVVYSEDWHKGVIGIVASRLIESYYRPTLVFTKSGEKLAASARSVKGFDIYNALEACKEYLEQFGGHKYAAGLSLEEAKYKSFKSAFEEYVKQNIDKKLLSPEIQIDSELSFEQITPKFYRILRQFGPFGPGNMTPVFYSKNLSDTGYARGVGEEGKHLKVNVTQKGSAALGGIGFNLGDQIMRVKNQQQFDAVYSLDENEWQGEKTLQLKIRDVK